MKNLAFPLYFNHVPKCAGTSLNELLSRSLHCRALGVEPFLSTLELYTLDAARLDQLMLVGSHLPHWVAARRMPGWTSLTVLREPWARFQSMTRHLFRIRHSEPHALLPMQVDFLALIEAGRAEEALRQAARWYPFHASMAQCFLPAPHEGEDGAERLGREATEVLRGYDVVLLSERLADDWANLERIFNGEPIGEAPRLNTSSDYGDAAEGPFPPSCETLFHTLFPFERAVYKAGQKLHAASSAMLAQRARQAVPLARGAAPNASCLVDWEAPARCAGLSDRVTAASFGYAGRVARRVEAGVGVIELDVPSARRARLEGVFWIGAAAGRFECRTTVNGRSVPMFDERLEAGCPPDPSQIWAAAEIPGEALAGGRMRIAFDRSRAAQVTEFWILDLAVRPL